VTLLQLRTGLTLVLDSHLLKLHPQKSPHVRPPVAPEQWLRHTLIIRHPKPRRSKSSSIQCFLRVRRQLILVLLRSHQTHNLLHLLLIEMLAQQFRQSLWFRDVDVCDEAVPPCIEPAFLESLAIVARLNDDHCALRDNAQDGKEGGRGEGLGAEMRDCALKVVFGKGGFGGECPGGFVARADVYAAEEDGVESGYEISWGGLS
jgi:hypothetical protein